MDQMIKNGPRITKADNVEFGDTESGQMSIFDYPAACPSQDQNQK